MADISLSLKHGKTKQEVLEKTKTILEKMSAKMGITVQWSGDRATLGGSGVKKGAVVVDDQNVNIDIDLALMAKPMKGMIEATINEKFHKALA